MPRLDANIFQLRDMQLGGIARERAETHFESSVPVCVVMNFFIATDC
jgi:hypothetical protein